MRINPMSKRCGKCIIIGLVCLLIVLHHDIWNWENKDPIFGFMPVALAWHAGISIGASLVWYLATRIAWPTFEDDEPISSMTSEDA